MNFDIYLDFKQAKDFAFLSKDFNPLHLNKIYARRTIYGEPVAHGISAVLKIIDHWLKKKSNQISITLFRSKFNKPIFYDVSYSCTIEEKNKEIKAYLSYNNDTLVEIIFKYTNCEFGCQKKIKIKDSDNLIEEPRDLQLEDVEGAKGEFYYFYESSALKTLYANIAECMPPSQIKFLLSSTYLVGMHTPGLNSIFSEISFSNLNYETELNSKVKYSVSKLYKSVRLSKINIKSDNYVGEIKAFIRPKYKKQKNISEVVKIVKKNEFKNQKALIIGGSRGLGEISAKIISAGGGAVSITYANGEIDANNVKNEIYNLVKKKIKIFKCDVMTFDFDELTNHNYTHIYYFATPKIQTSSSVEINLKLFENYYNFYVKYFSKILKSFKDFNNIKIFYPSTIFIDKFNIEFKEYIFSKMAAEKIIKLNNKIKIYRLPKLETDQTNSLVPEQLNNTLDVMYKSIKEFN